MGNGVEIFCELKVRIVLVRIVVYGIRYWTDIHVPLLALASEYSYRRNESLSTPCGTHVNDDQFSGLRRISDAFRRRLGHQPYIRDFRLLL